MLQQSHSIQLCGPDAVGTVKERPTHGFTFGNVV